MAVTFRLMARSLNSTSAPRFNRRVAAATPKPKPEPEQPKPQEPEQEAAISKGTITRLSAIADQGIEYNEEEPEPEPTAGQLVPFEPEPEDEARPPPVYTPKEIIKLNRQHAVIAMRHHGIRPQ
jgi:hypothetical protein